MKLGTLEIVSASENPDLLASPVRNFIMALPEGGEVGVAEIDPQFSDTAAFCENYKISPNQTANCVVLEAKRGDKTWLAACVILGSTKADINGLGKRTLDARRVSFAPMERAVEETYMEYGAITPVGLPEAWPVLIDKAVVDSEYIVIGSGLRKSKLVMPGKFLTGVPNARILDGLGKTSR